MYKVAIFVVLLSSIALQAAALDLSAADAGRKLKTKPDIRFGPECTNSYFKSGPDWKPKSGVSYKSCCDKKDGFICVTYKGDNKWSTYSTCMTLDACKASNGGKTKKTPGWNCKPKNTVAPECQNFFAKP